MIGMLRFTVEDFENDYARMKEYIESYDYEFSTSHYTCSVKESEETIDDQIPKYIYVVLMINGMKFRTLTFETSGFTDGNIFYNERNGELSETEEKLLFYIYNYRPE